jgi:protein required for attachment to host cells
MIIKSTYFEHERINKGTWLCPGTDVVNQIDHAIYKKHTSSVIDVKSCHGPNCDSDHFMVKVVLRERLSNVLKNQGRKRKKWSTDKLKNEENLNLYKQKINEKLEDIDETQDVQTEWNEIKNVILEAATETLGEKRKKK